MLKAIYSELGAYKGLNGKTATIGGCLEYTGAPYYAALASLRAAAGGPIKSYSPEIIVHPVLKASNEDPHLSTPESWSSQLDPILTKVTQWLPALHSLIIGPGLGRDPFLDSLTALLISKARDAGITHSGKLMVIDADGINVVCKHLDSVRGYPQAVLTPNIVEFSRLWSAVTSDPQPALGDLVPRGISVGEINADDPDVAAVVRLSRELGGCTVLLKGQVDIITNGVLVMAVGTVGSRKRCGGIGDILAGVVSTTLHLASVNRVPEAVVHACAAGCLITRKAACMAFEDAQWSLTAPDVLKCLPVALRRVISESSVQSLL